MTYTGHCTANPALATNQLPVPGVPGLGSVYVPSTVNGVAVILHGLQVAPRPSPLTAEDDAGGGFFPTSFGTWKTDLLADHWAVVYPSRPEDGYYSGLGAQAIYNDVNSDAGHGLQYLTTLLHWWDHVKVYCSTNWPGKAVILCGFSAGAYTGLQIAANRQADILGAVLHAPATIWHNVGSGFTPPVVFSSTTTTGMDAGTGILDSVTVPMMVSYGTADSAVGYDLAGTGGTPVSNTDLIISNAGANVTRRSTGNDHYFNGTDVTAFMSYITGTLDPLR